MVKRIMCRGAHLNLSHHPTEPGHELFLPQVLIGMACMDQSSIMTDHGCATLPADSTTGYYVI